MPSFLHLPIELIIQITTYISSFKTLAALICTHSYFSTHLTERLYLLALSEIRAIIPTYRRPIRLQTLSHLPQSPIFLIPGNGRASIPGWAILYGPDTLMRRLLRTEGGLSPRALITHWWAGMHHVPILSVAVIHLRLEVAAVLLEAGARPSMRESVMWAPLRYASTEVEHVKWNRIVVLENQIRNWTEEEVEMGRLLVTYNAIGR